MAKPASKLPLPDLTALARDVVSRHHHEVVGTVPSEGDSEYAELVVALNGEPGSSIKRLTIGVDRTESPECIREQIEHRIRARVTKAPDTQ